jgi:hypothetical protein
MKNKLSLLLSALLGLAAVTASGDTLELKNGTVLQGKYLGGTADTVRFQTDAGMQIVSYDEIKNMSVAPSAPAAAPAPVAAAPTSVTVPAGTLLLVRMMDSVSSRSSPGSTFTTKLEYDLVVNNLVIAKAGTVVYGRVESATQARRATGRSTLDIRLAQLSLGGSPVPILTSEYKEAGEASIKKVAVAAGVGAIIGNNVNGGGHGGGGAAWGAGIAMLKPGQTLTIPPGALLEFTLSQPVTIQVQVKK